MPITISGSTGISGVDGTVSSPAVQGADTNTGVYYPAADQVAIATGGVQRLLVDATGTVTTGVGALYPLVSGTAVASTSGTSIDFTGIPSWVKRVTVMLSGVSTNGTSSTQMQLGTSGGFVTSGYSSNFGFISSSSTVAGTTAITTGLTIFGLNASTDTISGVFTLCNLSGNIWAYSGIGCRTGNVGIVYVTATPQTLSGALTQIRITTVGGTDSFDAGSINILYEG